MRTVTCCLTILIAVLWISASANAGEILSWGVLTAPAGNDFEKVDGGYRHGVALRSDGSLLSFGNTTFLGLAPTGTGHKDVATGFYYGVAIRPDDSLVAWGKNNAGQLNVPAGNDFVAVAAGLEWGLALRSNGTLAAWGDNTYGQLNVPTSTTYKDIACGGFHGLALSTANIVTAWGKSNEGQLGVNGWPALDIASSRETTFIVRTSTALRGFGFNLGGERIVATGIGFAQVAGEYISGVALRADGTLATWGNNGYNTVSPYPAGGDFVSIGAGENTSYAIRFQPGWLESGSGTVTADGDGFTTGGYSVLGLGGKTPLPFTVSVEDLVLDAGMATLTVDYDPVEVAQAGLLEASLRLHWWDEGSSAWSLAGRSSNIDDSTGQFVAGVPTDVLGDWGVNTPGDYVWANIDHASTYGLAGDAIPEQGTLLLLGLGLGVLSRRSRTRRV